MKLEYELKQEEIEESLLCLNWKKEGSRKSIHIGIMGMVAVLCLLGYLWDKSRIHLFLLGMLVVGLMFMVLYLPEWKRKKKAKEMMKKNGIYKIIVPQKGIQKGFESEGVFTIQAGEQTYCIPKRILKGQQVEEIRENLQKHGEQIFEITTGRKKNES